MGSSSLENEASLKETKDKEDTSTEQKVSNTIHNRGTLYISVNLQFCTNVVFYSL